MKKKLLAVLVIVFINFWGYQAVCRVKTAEALNSAENAAVINGAGQVADSPIEINVKDYGAQGDAITDDTTAINKAIMAVYELGGGTVYIPAGTYMINTGDGTWVEKPSVSVNLKDNVKLLMSHNAILKAIPNSYDKYNVVRICNVTNVQVMGGNIVGDRDEHLGTDGEWGMGLRITGSNNIYVADVTISDCWGDGIYISSTLLQNYARNVVIANCICDNNRRQGISIISAINLLITDCVCKNTHGTDPQSGIAIEPDYSTEFMRNVVIENLHTEYNAGYGIVTWFGKDADGNPIVPLNNVSIIIKNHTDYGSRGGTLENLPYYIKVGYSINIG